MQQLRATSIFRDIAPGGDNPISNIAIFRASPARNALMQFDVIGLSPERKCRFYQAFIRIVNRLRVFSRDQKVTAFLLMRWVAPGPLINTAGMRMPLRSKGVWS